MPNVKLQTLQGLSEQMIDMGDGTVARQTVQAHAVYTLLSNQSTAGAGAQTVAVAGGDYLWRTEAANWNGATAALQFLGLDGVTWFPVRNAANTADVTLTSNGSVAIGVAQGSILRAVVTGANPTAMNAALGGL